MNNEFVRFERIVGTEAVTRLKQARIAVFGLGGVGGNCAEALARCGVGTLDLIDNDDVALSNLNRQVFALHSTVGMKKTEAAKARIHDISPETCVNVYSMFYLPEVRDQIPFREFDYVIDAIDTVTAKLDLVEQCFRYEVPVISSMGTGNRLDPSKLEIKDVYKTYGDPLAKVMRHELRKRGIEQLTVCCSREEPIVPLISEEETGRRSTPGSSSFVPPAAGILIASYVTEQLIGDIRRKVHK